MLKIPHRQFPFNLNTVSDEVTAESGDNTIDMVLKCSWCTDVIEETVYSLHLEDR